MLAADQKRFMRISVVTVCYNAAATIADTLDSVAAQTHPNIEHIVVDGASKDETMNVIHQHGGRVAKIISEPDKGIYDAMNKGLKHATGDVVGFLNADDFYASPQSLSLIADAFKDPSIDACYGDLCYVEQEDVNAIVRYWRSSPFKPRLFEVGWCPPHPTFYARRSVFEKYGHFDASYRIAGDADLMMRFLERDHIRAHYIHEVLVKMRVGGASNQSLSSIIKQNKEVWRSLKAYGLEASLFRFVGGKFFSRGLQFITRPSENPEAA